MSIKNQRSIDTSKKKKKKNEQGVFNNCKLSTFTHLLDLKK